MSDKQVLRRRLEAIKELKAQYYVGSQAAFNYLKEMRWYEQLREEILRLHPTLKEHYDLTVRKTAWFAHALKSFLKYELELASLKASSPDNDLLDTEHLVIFPTDKKEEKTLLGFNYHEYVWSVNYAEQIGHFLQEMLSDQQEQVWEEEHVEALSAWVHNNFLSGNIQPILDATGEPVSYHTLVSDDRFRSNISADDNWDSVSALIDLGFKNLYTDQECDDLRQAQQNRDCQTAHLILQSIKIRYHIDCNHPLKIQSLQNEWRAEVTQADYWLFDSELYERSEREYTLGLREIERRIALNEIHNQTADIDSPRDAIDMLIADSKQFLQRSMGRLREHQENRVPRFIIERTAYLVAKYRYLYLALHQNRKWLIEFLSH